MLILYLHSVFLCTEFIEQIRKIQGNILIKNGYSKDIAKLINIFLKINIWVFWYTAPNEDNNIQKKPRKIKPKIKNIVYLIIKSFFTFSEMVDASDDVWALRTLIIFLSDKNTIFIIVVR